MDYFLEYLIVLVELFLPILVTQVEDSRLPE